MSFVVVVVVEVVVGENVVHAGIEDGVVAPAEHLRERGDELGNRNRVRGGLDAVMLVLMKAGTTCRSFRRHQDRSSVGELKTWTLEFAFRWVKGVVVDSRSAMMISVGYFGCEVFGDAGRLLGLAGRTMYMRGAGAQAAASGFGAASK